MSAFRHISLSKSYSRANPFGFGGLEPVERVLYDGYNQYSGAVTQQTDYYPYGLPKAKSTNAEANPFKYIDKELTTNLSTHPDPKNGDYTGQRVQNDYLAVKYRLTKAQRRILHDEVSHQGLSFKEIEDLVKELFNK